MKVFSRVLFLLLLAAVVAVWGVHFLKAVRCWRGRTAAECEFRR